MWNARSRIDSGVNRKAAMQRRIPNSGTVILMLVLGIGPPRTPELFGKGPVGIGSLYGRVIDDCTEEGLGGATVNVGGFQLVGGGTVIQDPTYPDGYYLIDLRPTSGNPMWVEMPGYETSEVVEAPPVLANAFTQVNFRLKRLENPTAITTVDGPDPWVVKRGENPIFWVHGESLQNLSSEVRVVRSDGWVGQFESVSGQILANAYQPSPCLATDVQVNLSVHSLAKPGTYEISLVRKNGSVLPRVRDIEVAFPAAKIIDPEGSTLSSSTVTFRWEFIPGLKYQLGIGTGPGTSDIFNRSDLETSEVTVSGIPLAGVPLYVNLISRLGPDVVQPMDSKRFFTPFGVAAKIIDPPEGSTLSSSTVTFRWEIIPGLDYQIAIGTGPEMFDIYYRGRLQTGEVTVSGIPLTGEPVYVQLITTLMYRLVAPMDNKMFSTKRPLSSDEAFCRGSPCTQPIALVPGTDGYVNLRGHRLGQLERGVLLDTSGQRYREVTVRMARSTHQGTRRPIKLTAQAGARVATGLRLRFRRKDGGGYVYAPLELTMWAVKTVP